MKFYLEASRLTTLKRYVWMKIKTFKATLDCRICKGKCCKTMGCHYSPGDFEDLSFVGLKKEIEKGFISIDWWENPSGPEYYLRARNVGEPIVCGSWGGVCVHLTPEGCALSWDERPLGGKALKPGKNNCKAYYTKEDSKNDWKKHRDVLVLLVVYFRTLEKY